MNSNGMKLKLPNSVSSPQDLDNLLIEVKQYSSWFSHNAIKKRVRAGKLAEPPAVSAASLEVIKQWAAQNPLNTQSFDRLISALKDYMKSAPCLSITLAAPATNDTKKTLTSWFRDNVSPDILVTYKFNSTLLGGMVVQFGSHIYDWSFRRGILNHRKQFTEVLRRV